mgnify:CR=1 FL=1
MPNTAFAGETTISDNVFKLCMDLRDKGFGREVGEVIRLFSEINRKVIEGIPITRTSVAAIIDYGDTTLLRDLINRREFLRNLLYEERIKPHYGPLVYQK